MKHRTCAIILFFLCMVLTAVTVTMGSLAWGGEVEAAAAAGEDAPEETAVPTATAEPSDALGPDVPERAVEATEEYFADAAFLGNSVLGGLWLYNNDLLLPSDTSHWYWSDSLTILGASPYAAQMADQQYGKIYIELGINELNYDKDALKTAFNTVIDQLQNDHPDAIIYLMSVTPVSKYCDGNLGFTRSGVISFNKMLKEIAEEQGIWYLDVYPELCGEDGFLPSDVTPDGIHFTPAHYQLWLNYMKTHYVPDETTPDAPLVTAEPEVPEESPAEETLEETEA